MQEVFAEILLNVIGIKDLYEAWENHYYNLLEDYKGNDGEKCKAQKVEWINKLPRIINMQMNRIMFDKGNAEKINSQMTIEPIIYADRFLLKNKEESSKLRKYVHTLREKVKHLENCLDQYKNFEGSQYNISQILSLASTFFSKQNSASDFKSLPETQSFIPLG